MKEKYVIGYDFGTESGRALLVNVKTGEEVATAAVSYPHGVIERALPDSGVELGEDWALQHPQDYLDVLREVTPAVLKQARAKGNQVIGIGVDFTSCTLLPTDRAGTPLCLKPEFRANPNAWVKLWKHHAAQPEAEKVNQKVAERGETFLQRYGGKISSEWLLPKAWQILDEAPEVYAAAARIIEGGDWIVWRLTGNERRSACMAGYKACWTKTDGYPSREFLASLDGRLADLVGTRLSTDIHAPGTRAGALLPDMAKEIGLVPGIPVAVPIIDAHAAVPACTVAPDQLVLILGTSFCHLMLGRKEKLVPGICGVVADGILPGLYGYEAGQAAGGDIYAWFVENSVPKRCFDEAESNGMDIHAFLEQQASKLRPGESGLVALDWWNGNRSVLVDAELTGLIVGFTMSTTPAEVYRALIEATAFGTLKIIRTMETAGLAIKSCYASGGLPEKNRLVMQIFADVTGREFKVCASKESCALGAAMLGALAAGSKGGGYDSMVDASKVMSKLKKESYAPNRKHTAIYAKLFTEYERLHDHFGRGGNPVMKFLKRSKTGA
jgi:L-ribulokinase